MIHAAGDFADFRMQRAAKGDVHFLQAAADSEYRHATGNTGFGQRQRDIIAVDIVGLMLFMRLGLEARRVDIGPGAGQHHPVDRVKQGTDIGDLGRSGKHQRQRARDVGHRTKVAFSDHLGCEAILDAMGVPDHTDYGPSHRQSSAFIVQRKDISRLGQDSARSCLRDRAGST